MEISMQVKPFVLQKGIPTETYKYTYDEYKKIYFLFVDRKRKIKTIDDSYRKVIAVMDDNDNYEYFAVFKMNTTIEEQKNGRIANMMCNKLVKSLDDGDFKNHSLMEDILRLGVAKLRNCPNHEFNLPLLKAQDDSYEESDVESLDLNNAYARCLWNSGLINWHIYQMLITAKKEIRLRVIGMLARGQNIKIYSHEGDVTFQHSYKTKYHALFRFAESKVAADMVYMKHILTEKYFIFYWVDGIYYRKSTPPNIKKELERYLNGEILPRSNYEFKFEAVPYLKYYKEGKKRFMYLTKVNKHGEPEPKLYSLSRAWLQEQPIEVV
jgi:hypothetical protein